MNKIVFSLGLVFLLLGLGACKELGKLLTEPKAPKQKPLEDKDYCFRIAPPGGGWKLMNEEEVRKLSPDAMAGAVDLNLGLFGVVIIEPAPDVALLDFAKLVADNMAMENKQVGEMKPMKYSGEDAVRFSLQGTTEGVPIRFFNQVFIHSGYAYQILAWGMASRVDNRGQSLQAFYDAFSLTPGPVRGRIVGRKVIDSAGVGWRVKDGIFESAIHRMRVEPKEPFRLVVGAELTRMNDSAEIGLSSDSAYLILVAERVSKVGQKAYAKKLLADSLRNINGKVHGETLEIDLDGRKVTLTRMRNAGQPSFEYLHGVFFEGNRAIQVLVWYLTSLETKAAKILPAGFASIRFLADGENAALRAEMSQGPDSQNRVGADFSLRRGVYRDFAHGLVWHKPAGFWRIAVGQQARSSNKAASLFIEEAALGIFGLLIIEPSTGLTGPAYHALVQKAAFPGVSDLETQDLKVDGKPAKKSEALREINGIKLCYQALSWVQGQHAFQFLFWGIPEAMQAAEKTLNEARAGLRLPGRSLRAETNEGSTHLDHRFGYRYSPPGEGWSLKDLTPPELRSIGQVLDWQKGNKHVLLVSVCALEPGQDRSWFLTLASQIMRSNMKGLSIIAPTRSTLEHAGIKWDHLAWRGSGKADALLATRDKTFFAIMSASDFFVGLDLKKVVSGFSFLD